MSSPAPSLHDSPPDRLLVRSVNWLGDAVMSTPALLRIRERFPKTHIALLTRDNLADLWAQHPAVDQVIAFDRNDSPWKVGRRIRAGNFDTGLIFPNSHRAALEMWFGNIPRRIGVKRSWRNWLLTHVIPSASTVKLMRKRPDGEIHQRIRDKLPREAYPAESHQLYHYLMLAGALGVSTTPLAPELVVSSWEYNHLKGKPAEMIGPSSLHKPPCFAMCPGAEYGPAKRWPAESFIKVANAVAIKTQCRWMILGGPKEAAIGQQIQSHAPSAYNLCGQTSLRELMMCLASSKIVLTNDSGPMHLAASLGTPVVALFASTSPELTGPGLPGNSRHSLITAPTSCSPCFQRECPVGYRCMQDITPEQVIESVLKTAGWTDRA